MVRKIISFLIVIVLLGSIVFAPTVSAKTMRADYFAYVQETAEAAFLTYDSSLAEWRNTADLNYIFGYNPPTQILQLALVSGFLYQETGEARYGDWAKRLLLDYGSFKELYPDSLFAQRPEYQIAGLPAIPNCFLAQKYFQAYVLIRDDVKMLRKERRTLEQYIAESAEFQLLTQEWGAMNRAILRAEILAWAVEAIPDHPRVPVWKQYAEIVARDSWGNWEIEDATGYHGVWLWSLTSYSEAVHDNSIFDTPEMLYYAHYFLNLLSPDGSVPEFGDSRRHSSWPRFLVMFEKWAAEYQNPQFKWAANYLLENCFDWENAARTPGMAVYLLDAYRWADDAVNCEAPTGLSDLVMEDVQGKKIVFRDGWTPNSTYMLLNYRDEGMGGWRDRNYLRSTIPVEEEKMTHGHADENGIGQLMWNGSLLLTDAGYRNFMPSGKYGAFRQDYFHNRVCVRQEKMWMGQKAGEYRYSTRDAVPGQPVLEFLRNSGAYRKVQTQLVEFFTSAEWDISRTRVIDAKLGYQWERVVNYVKDPEMFVIFDVVQADVEEYFTAANLWHTRKIVEQGENWYLTSYDSLRNLPLNTDNNLLIYFPESEFKIQGVENSFRNHVDELTIHQTASQHFYVGDQVVFTTVLVPMTATDSPEKWISRIESMNLADGANGVGVQIQTEKGSLMIGAKPDLLAEMVRDNTRPRYTYAGGRCEYGKIETDAHHFFARIEDGKVHFSAANLIKFMYDGKVGAEQPALPFGLSNDGLPDRSSPAKLRGWNGTIPF